MNGGNQPDVSKGRTLAMTKTDDKVDRVERWIYAGRLCDHSAKTVQVRYVRPGGDFAFFDLTPKNRASHKKTIGGQYDVEIVKTDSAGEAYRIAGAKPVGRIDDRDRIVEWQAADATVTATIDAARMVDKGKADALESAMLPLRKAYAKLPFSQKTAFELWVLARLRRGAL